MALQASREELRQQEGRDKQRAEHFSARAQRRPALGRVLADHLSALALRKVLLERRRQTARQAADALAWLVLQDHPSSIAILYHPQTHDVPQGIGLVGLMMVEEVAHGSGSFLVIENDLTRCLGTGDLTVVSRRVRDLPPIPVEVKASGSDLSVGAEVGVGLYMLEVNDPRALPVFQELQSLVGSEERPTERGVEPSTQQLKRFFRQGEALVREYGRKKAILGRPSPHWSVMERVACRALGGQATFDAAERGLVYFALPVSDNPEWVAEHESLQRRVAELVGVSAERPWHLSASIDVVNSDAASVVVVPIPLWRLSVEVKMAVLNLDLIIGSYMDYQVLVEHSRDRGVTLDVTGAAWHATKGDVTMTLPPADRARIMAEVAFGGAGLASLADKIAEGFGS